MTNYRTKIYVVFDGDTDMKYYRMLQAWDENDDIDFDFNDAHELSQSRDESKEESIKANLRNRLSKSKIVILLIGEHTKNLHKFVQWEIETAIKMELPIICVNLNGKNTKDDLSPNWLNEYPCIYGPFSKKYITKALESWPNSFKKHRQNGDKNSYHYSGF